MQKTGLYNMATENEYYMRKALELAQKGAQIDEVPVGAIIVREKKIIATAHNKKERFLDSTKHAEIIAIQKASSLLHSWRLLDCTLYVTLEPCLMCAGALLQSRIKKVVYGAPDPKAGALGSLYEVHKDSRLNHSFTVINGVLKNECAEILKNFFKEKRK